jgi:peptidoglycan/xylan/chitin deacetylase (PgdA/CDA1 family)
MAAVLLMSLGACEQDRAQPYVQQQSVKPLPSSPEDEGQLRRSTDGTAAQASPQVKGLAAPGVPQQGTLLVPRVGPHHSDAADASAGSDKDTVPESSDVGKGAAASSHANASTATPPLATGGPSAAPGGDTLLLGPTIPLHANTSIGPAIPPNASAGPAAIPPNGNAGADASAGHARTAGKVAYLTFDDGPSASTDRLLAILRRYGVKATFFVVGTTSDEGKALYRKIAAEGHVLGNHTFSHDYRSVYRSPEAFRQDVDKLNALLEETTGRKPDILRYPGGSNNKLGRKYGGAAIMSRIIRDMRAQGYQYFDWSVSSTDAAAPVQEREVIVGSVLSASRGLHSAIVLMHDNARKTTTLEALPTVIEGLRRQGFAFDVLRRSTEAVHFLEPD